MAEILMNCLRVVIYIIVNLNIRIEGIMSLQMTDEITVFCFTVNPHVIYITEINEVTNCFG